VEASPYWELWARESVGELIENEVHILDEPDALGGKHTSYSPSTSSAFNTSAQREYFQGRCNLANEYFLRPGQHAAHLGDSASEPYQPDTFHGSGDDVLEESGSQIGTIPSLQIERVDNEWWNVQLTEDENGFDGLDWFNFSYSDTWTYLI